MGLVNKSGKIVLLRVNEVGDRFGPAADFIEAEVVVQLDTHLVGQASGFKLRSDANQPVRQGMLDLMRDAFNHGWRLHFDHEVPTGKQKGIIVRAWVTKDAPPPPAPPSGPGGLGLGGHLGGAGSVGGVVFGSVAGTMRVAPREAPPDESTPGGG